MRAGPAPRSTAAVVAVVAALLAVAAACSVEPEGGPEVIAREDVPFGLADPDRSTSTNPTVGTGVEVFMVRDGRLEPVVRSLPAGSPLEELVAVAAQGPDEDEAAEGLVGVLPPDQVAGVTAARGVAQVDLAGSFAELRSEEQQLAIGQIVFTLTGQAGVGRVAFTLEGESVEVPRGDGVLTTDSLARDDMEELAPEP